MITGKTQIRFFMRGPKSPVSVQFFLLIIFSGRQYPVLWVQREFEMIAERRSYQN